MKYNYLDFLKKTIKIKGKIIGITASHLTNNCNTNSISFIILVKFLFPDISLSNLLQLCEVIG